MKTLGITAVYAIAMVTFLTGCNPPSEATKRKTNYYTNERLKEHKGYYCQDGIEYLMMSDFHHGFMSPHVKNEKGEVFTCDYEGLKL